MSHLRSGGRGRTAYPDNQTSTETGPFNGGRYADRPDPAGDPPPVAPTLWFSASRPPDDAGQPPTWPPEPDTGGPETGPWPAWDRHTTDARPARVRIGRRPGPVGIAVVVAAVLAAFGLGAALISPMFSRKPAATVAAPTTGPGPVSEAPQPVVSDGPSGDPTPSEAPSASAPSRASEAAVVAFENSVVDLVNQERRRHRCDPVRNDTSLRAAAREHSVDMGARTRLNHTGSDGSSADDRIRAAGFNRPLSENLAVGFRSPEQVMSAWLRSRGHRNNIIDCDARAVGVGLAVGRDGKAYWTQDFAR